MADGYDSFSELPSSESPSAQPSDSPAGTSASAAIALVVQGLELNDGHIIIDDRQAKSRTELSSLNLSTGNLLGDEFAEMRAAGRLNDSGDAADLIFDLKALAKIDTKTLGLDVRDLSSKVTLGSQSMDISLESFNFQQSQEVLIQGLTADVLESQIRQKPLR